MFFLPGSVHYCLFQGAIIIYPWTRSYFKGIKSRDTKDHCSKQLLTDSIPDCVVLHWCYFTWLYLRPIDSDCDVLIWDYCTRRIRADHIPIDGVNFNSRSGGYSDHQSFNDKMKMKMLAFKCQRNRLPSQYPGSSFE